MLRNQYVALQRGANQGVYVPDTASSLFNPMNNHSAPLAHPLLFDKYRPVHVSRNIEKQNIGHGLFYNNTRTQMKQLSQI